MKVPREFLRALQDADPLLSCRWSDAFKCWAIERAHPFVASEVEMYLQQHKAEESLRVNAENESEAVQHDTSARLAWENFESARHRHALILLTPFTDIRTFARLYEMDVTRNGGFKRYHDRIVAENERERTQTKREHYWDGRERAEEMASFVSWAGRKRQTEILMGPEGGRRLVREAFGGGAR